MITEEENQRYAELQLMALDAARTGNDELLGPMLAAGMPVNLADEKGNSLLMLASYHGNLETTRLLLRAGASPDQRNARNQTPLAGVAFKGDLAAIKLLIENGADPHADQGGGRLPIHFAALFGHTDIVEYLETLSSTAKTSRLRHISKITSVIRQFILRIKNKRKYRYSLALP